jgi:hypothetical protein
MAIRRFDKDFLLRRQARWKWRGKSLETLIPATEMVRSADDEGWIERRENNFL